MQTITVQKSGVDAEKATLNTILQSMLTLGCLNYTAKRGIKSDTQFAIVSIRYYTTFTEQFKYFKEGFYKVFL